MQERNKYLLKNIFSFVLGKMGPRLISFFLVPLYTYTLTTEEYGTIDLIATLSTVLMPILVLNIGDAIMRFALDHGTDHRKLMSIGLWILGAGTLLGLVLIPVAGLVPTISAYGLALYGYVISLAYMQVFCCYLRGCEKLNAYAIGNILHTASLVGLNLLFLLVFQWGIRGYLLANILSNFLTAIYAAVVGRVDRVVKKFSLDFPLFGSMIRYSSLLIPSNLMWWIVQSSDRIMITYMVSAAANGIYAVSYKLPSILSTLSGIFNQAWLYSAIREKDSADATKYFNQMYDTVVRFLIIVTSGMLLVLKPFLSIYVASEYYMAWRYTPYLLIGFMLLAIAGFLATFSTVHKDSKTIMQSSLCGAVTNIVLNFVTIPWFGVMGAAFSTCISYVMVFLFRIFYTNKHYVKINAFQFRHLMGYGVIVAMSLVLFYESTLSWVLLTVLFAINLYLSKDVILLTLKRLTKNKRNKTDNKR